MPLSVQAVVAKLQEISESQEGQANQHEPYGNATDFINNFDTWLP